MTKPFHGDGDEVEPSSTGSEPTAELEQFREAGYAAIDFIVEYMKSVGELPVRSNMQPGEFRAGFPETRPSEPRSLSDLVAGLQQEIVPGLTHWQHPSFFAYFPANNAPASILGDLISTGLGVNGMLWATSPAATELETLMLDWLVDALGLPEAFHSTGQGGGVIQGTASEATLCALLAAREQVTKGDGNRLGMRACAPLAVYATEESHSSLMKAVRIAGLGSDSVRFVATSQTFGMDPEALATAIAEDAAAGKKPFFVFATHGTTSTMAFDPTAQIGPICRKHGLWLHVDAAMSGIAALCTEHRWVNNGLEYADSYCTNPHKWMGVVFDCDAFWVRDRQALTAALSITPDYLRTSHSGKVIDYRDWQIPLGRRFRALKLWFSLRSDGVERAQALIRSHCALTQGLAAWVRRDARLRIAAPHPLNLLTLCHSKGDQATERMVQLINASGRTLVTQTKVQRQTAMRVSIGARLTQAPHVEAFKNLLAEVLDAVDSSM
jgi:aromatic-L-amino-acid/L-tryptophan decarboxylase